MFKTIKELYKSLESKPHEVNESNLSIVIEE